MNASAFPWRRLTSASTIEHRVNEQGELALRAEAQPPFATASVRDGAGGFVDRRVEELGFAWTVATTGEWVLRTSGEPVTMTRVRRVWGELARVMTAASHVDERIVLTTIACESGGPLPDANGHVKAPRTERGYPRRAGERDPGDFERDAEDWQHAGGRHSSHGLMQTLVSTAVAARPDLFRDRSPSEFRTVLWSPANSIACGIAYLASFAPEMLADPLATRIKYGAGSIRPTTNRWGAVVYDDLVPLSWIAFWNDDVAARRQSTQRPFLATSTTTDRPSASGAMTLLFTGLFVIFGAVLGRGVHR